jgi:hypothetical protein
MLASARFWNIALRTAHLAAMGVLLGGHCFDVPRERLLFALWLTLGSGAALVVAEAWGGLLWFHQGRGLITLAKLALLPGVHWCWDYRVPILLAVVVLGSVGSHAPARFRYYSVLYRRVIPCSGGPGSARLTGELAQSADPGENGA